LHFDPIEGGTAALASKMVENDMQLKQWAVIQFVFAEDEGLVHIYKQLLFRNFRDP
jgi:hypothetical protein